MSGKIIAIFLVLAGLVAGVALYYLQVYAFYEPVTLAPGDGRVAEIRLVPLDGAEAGAVVVSVAAFEGIDADSSPLRFRACFTLDNSLAMLTETYAPYDGATPLSTPRWFSCFDAKQIGDDLQSGAAVAFLSEPDIHPGVDRVIAAYPDGRAYAWHQLNESAKD